MTQETSSIIHRLERAERTITARLSVQDGKFEEFQITVLGLLRELKLEVAQLKSTRGRKK